MNPVDFENPYDKYLAYLDSQTWAELRNKALERDEYHCCICNSPHNLEVHHLRYPQVLGTERISDLMTLCDKCHEKLEQWKKGHTSRQKMVIWTPPKRVTWIKFDTSEEAKLFTGVYDNSHYDGDEKLIVWTEETQNRHCLYLSKKALREIEDKYNDHDMVTQYT